ncbi:hypothetical protein M1V59_30610, partial [Escherichia coli]|nr:hypothetical protein [Escherichia coli]
MPAVSVDAQVQSQTVLVTAINIVCDRGCSVSLSLLVTYLFEPVYNLQDINMQEEANKILVDLLKKASDGIDSAIAFSQA